MKGDYSKQPQWLIPDFDVLGHIWQLYLSIKFNFMITAALKFLGIANNNLKFNQVTWLWKSENENVDMIR